MKTISIEQFEHQCRFFLEEVEKTQEPLLLTKEGKFVANIVPYSLGTNPPKENPLKDSITFETDIVSPIPENWNADS